MGTTTYTVAQALATTASSLLVVDSAANIASNAGNGGLVSRVTAFSMSANGAVSAWQAAALAALGSKFTRAGYTITMRDTVAQLTAVSNAAGLTVSGIVVAVSDTAANILAAAGNSIIHSAASIALTANATLSLAQLLTLETWPSFTAAGLTLTLADSAANLLALTPAQSKAALTVFHVAVSSSVSSAQAVTLQAMSHFAITSGTTLTIADTIANISAATTGLATLLAMSGTAVRFSDTMANLLAQAVNFHWTQYPHAAVVLSASATATVSQVATLAALPQFAVAAGQMLTIADTVAHLLSLQAAQTALAGAITLSGNDTATAAQLVSLAALAHFTPGHTLAVTDTVAHLATLTSDQRGLATSVAIDDTVANLLIAPPSVVTGSSSVVAELDGTTLNAYQAATLAALGAHATLTLHASGTATSLTISDSAANLSAAAPSIAALQADGPVSVVTIASADRSILSAAAAVALIEGGTDPASEIVAVADTGAALAAVADQIFGHGFQAITVTTGTLGGTLAHLLDPTLRFGTGASAQLNSAATVTTAQLAALAALPRFSMTNGTTLVVADSVTNILAAAATLGNLATSVLANDTETVTAAQAAVLAALPGFSLHGNFLIVGDTAANIAAATAAAITLASSVNLVSDARIPVATALQLAAIGDKFSPAGYFVDIADTAANLATLAANATALGIINGWNGEAVLSADGSTNVAGATALTGLAGFNVGTHHLTIADTAAHLLGAGSTVLALAFAAQLSQASTVTAADTATLAALRGFTAGSLLTIADTPTHLAAMAPSLASLANVVTLATETGGNAGDYAVTAGQLAALLALPHITLSSFTGTIAVTDTAAALLGLGSALGGLTGGQLSHITTTLGAAATVTAANATALHALPGFATGSFSLTISDTAAHLLGLDGGTAALAAAIDLSAPATITVATANSLAALHQFTTDAEAITVADTPAALAAQSNAVAAIAGSETILPYSAANAGAYTLTGSQFLALAGHATLSFTGFGGPLVVQDTAFNLASLAGAFIGAGPGSTIALSRAVITTSLSQSETVDAGIMAYLVGMPGFGVNGHTLTLQDTPTALLANFSGFVPYATQVALASNETAWVVSAAQAGQLAAIGPFQAGSAGMTVSDTAANLLATASATGVAAATATALDADATVSVSQAEALHALHGFGVGSYHLTIIDTPANLAMLDAATAALATTIETVGGGSALSAAAFLALVNVPGFNGSAGSLSVSDTADQLLTLVGSDKLSYLASTSLSAGATLTAAGAVALGTLPHLLLANDLAIADTAANLLQITGGGGTPDDWTMAAQASSVTLTAAATITAAQAGLLSQLGNRFGDGGFSLAIQDAPSALLGLSGTIGAISGQVSAVVIAPGTWTVTLAQAQTLDTLPNLSAGTATVTVADTAATLSAGTNAGLIASIIAGAPSITFTLAGADTATVAQAQALHALGTHFSRGSDGLTIIDGAGHLATLDSGTAGMASAIQLQGSALTSVANFQVIRGLPNYSAGSALLVVYDTAAHLLTLVGTDVSRSAEIMLSDNPASLSALQAEELATLGNFTTGIAHFAIRDSADDLLAGSGGGANPTDWAGEIAAASVTLTGDATVDTAQANIFALLGSRFSAGTAMLTVSDTAANLAAAANADGVALAGTVTLAGNEAGLAAATATRLASLAHFTKGTASVTVSDTAAALAFAGNAAGLALADHIQLSQAAALSVAAAEALIGLAAFQTNGSAPLTIADTLPNLLLLAGASLPHNAATLAGTAIGLSADGIATVAQLTALQALSQYDTFSLNGFAITLEDSGRHLASFTPHGAAIPSGYVMIGDATLSATQAGVLAAENASIGDNALVVADTPAALLSLSAGVDALATGLMLSGAATASASQAETLAADARFTTGGQALTITAPAAVLLGLSHAAAQWATTLALAESGDTVSAAGLLQLTGLGGKFTLDSHTLTVADSADQLATLNNLETALVTAAMVNQTETIAATIADTLGALPGLAVANGVTLTVQGTYAQLAALPASVQAIATLEVTGGGPALTAAQAATLAGLTNFAIGNGIVVQDTIADLDNNANDGWQTVATGGYIATDLADNVLAAAATQLLTHANSVTLLADAQLNAADFAMLAAIANFTPGTALVTVEDSAAAIAADAAAIVRLGSHALVTAVAPVSAAQAEALSTVNTAHLLSFTGGISLTVQDTEANLTAPANAAGLALATAITVRDTAADLITASSQDWGSISPFYALSAGGTVTAAQAAALHALGGHFLANGFTLTVADAAAAVTANAAAIQALGIVAQVSDTAADIGAAATALQALGSTLQSITLTDSGSVDAATAAALLPLAAILTAPAIAVTDTAAAIDASLAALLDLGTHLAGVTVHDSLAAIAPYATDLATLGAALTVSLTDSTPASETADTAAALAPLAARLGANAIDVSDTAAHVAADATALAGLGTALHTVTLSDGTTVTAARAAALAAIDSHLAPGVHLSVADTAAAIAGAAAGIATLGADSRLGSVTAANETAAHIVTYGSALADLGATATISDTAAHVAAQLDSLEPLSGAGGVLQQVTLSNGGTPDLTVSLWQLANDSDVLGRITGAFRYAVADSAAAIAADLADGTGSQLSGLGAALHSVTVAGGTLSLAATTLFTTGVDGAGNALLDSLAGGTSLAVTAMTVDDFAGLAGLAVAPTSFTVADTAGAIATDLALGGSALLAYRTAITTITPDGSITLGYAVATTAHVNDGAGSVFDRMTGATLLVTGVPAAGIDALFATGLAPSSITVTDTAAGIAADLATASPALLQHAAAIGAITLSPATAIALDAAHVLVAGVDDGAGSVFGKIGSLTLDVTGATVAQLDALHARSHLPDSVALSDDANSIAGDLALGAASRMETYAADGMLTAVAVTGGTVSLAATAIVPAIADALALLPASALQVTGVPVGAIATIAALGALDGMTVRDSAASIAGDLRLDAGSELAQHHAAITDLTVTGGPVVLDDADALAAAANALALLPTGSLQVTGVAVADLAAVTAIAALASLTVSDTAADVGAAVTALQALGSTLQSITLTDSGAVGAATAAALLPLAAMLTAPAIAVTDTAAAIDASLAALLDLGTHLAGVTVHDSLAAIAQYATDLATLGDALTVSLTDSTPASETADTAAALAPLAAWLGTDSIDVSDTAAAIAADATALAGLGTALHSVTLSDGTGVTVATAIDLAPVVAKLTTALQVADTAANVHADLAGGSPVLEAGAHAGTIATITVNDAPVGLTDTQAEAVLHALGVLTGAGGLTVSDVSVQDLPAIGMLAALTGMTVNDTAAHISTDLLRNTASDLHIYQALITGMTVTAGTVNLPYTDIANVQSDALGLLPSNTLAITGVPVDQVTTMVSFPGLYQMTVSDTAANVQTDIAAGGSHVLEGNHGKITGITVTGGPVTLAEGDATAALDALAVLAGVGTLVVTDVTLAALPSVAALSALDHITVADDATTLQTDLALGNSVLEQAAGVIQSIAFSNGAAVTLTGVEAARVMDALALLPAASLTVTDALASEVAGLGALASLAGMTVDDTGAHLQANLSDGAASSLEQAVSHITGITVSSGNIELSDTAANAVLDALAKLPSGTLVVDGVSVAHIAAIAGLGAVLSGMSVADAGTAVTADLAGANSKIATDAGIISGISLSSGSVSLTDGEAQLVMAALPLLPSGSLSVSSVPITDIAGLYALGAPIAGIAVSDSGAAVAADLAGGGVIMAAIAKIGSISLTGGSVALTDSQADAAMAALAELPASCLSVSAVPVGDVAALAALAALSSMTVTDTGAAVATDLARVAAGQTSVIAQAVAAISGITLSSGAVSLSDGQADAAFAALARLPGGSLSVTDVPLSDIAHIASLGAILSGMTVSDSGTAVQDDLTSGTVLSTHAGAITAISLSSGQVTLTDTQATSMLALLGKLSGGSLVVTDVPAADVATIGALAALSHMTVLDSGSVIQSNLAGGSSSILADLAAIATVTITDASLDATTAAAIYDGVGTKFVETALVVSDTAANLLAIHGGADAAVLPAAAMVALSANGTVTAAQATTLAGLLHGGSSAFTITVADSCANLLAGANAAGIALAAALNVSDTAANIQSLAPMLIALEPKLDATTITDNGPLTAAAVANLLALPNLSAGSLTIADSGSQIAAAINASGAAGVDFLKAHSVQLSANSIIAASDAAALEQLGVGGLNKSGFTISVSDTASHLTDTVDQYLSAVSDTALVDGVYLKTTGGSVTLTAATAAGLTAIPNFHKNPVGGGTNVVIVQDTAAHLDSNYATLHANLALFDHLYLSASASVTDAVYGDLLNLGAQKASGSITVTVRDTAATIAANATSQLAGSPGITPAAWQLSGSATVSEAQAATLGALSGFGAGAYTLTLSGSASGVSVSDANALGALGSAFHLGGYTVAVSGPVASLAALTGAALAVVTPQIQDSFGNIVAGLTAASPLLAGTMTITDAEAISVAQATSFFSLVKVGSGSGIPAASITFSGGAESITDTLANVQALTGLAGWTQNSSLHADFHLVVADSVAVLTDAANTAALSGMYGTTLPGDQTVGAAALETLFTMENTIHFSLGSNHVTVQDSAANLLNPTYSDAIAMATQVTLPGPDTVNAAGAESLIGTGKLALTGGTILTISDTSSGLLDGVLGTAISGGGFTSHVHVSLSDAETLDAQTAEALVSLPGYTAVPDTLSIVDGVSYLLNAANHDAEVAATSVTLDGDAYVSAVTAVQLVAIPNFSLDGSILHLASSDYANAATLDTLAGLGAGFDLNGNTLTMNQDASVDAVQLAGVGGFGNSLHLNGHSLTMTQDALALTPDLYTAVLADNVVHAGYALSAIPDSVTVDDVGGSLSVSGNGVGGATVTLYAADGSVATTVGTAPGFTIGVTESGAGVNVAVTETVGGVESAPLIALEQTILTSAASADGATFAASGQVQVGAGAYMDLYTAGTQPGSPAHPVLVYDPAAHTLSFDATGHAPVVLLTLGTATHPASLDPSEIFVKHYVA